MTQNTKHKLAEQYLLAMRAGDIFPNYSMADPRAPQKNAFKEDMFLFRKQAELQYPCFRNVNASLQQYFQLTKNVPAYSYNPDQKMFDLIFPAYTIDSDFTLVKNVPVKEVFDILKNNMLQTTKAMMVYDRNGPGGRNAVHEGRPPAMWRDLHKANSENCERFFEATGYDVLPDVDLILKHEAMVRNLPKLFGQLKEQVCRWVATDGLIVTPQYLKANFLKNPALNN